MSKGTWIKWRDNSQATGWSQPWFVTAEQYRSLLSKFSGQEVPLGNYRDPAPGTMEAWLKRHDFQWGAGLALQISQILVTEGYAHRATQRGRINFYQYTPNSVPPGSITNPVPPHLALPNSVTNLVPLRSYFETADQQRRALEVVAREGWLDPSGNLDLYEDSRRAFDSKLSADERSRYFEKIYNTLKGPGWQVFRSSLADVSYWTPSEVFETIEREFREFSWNGSVNLLNFQAAESSPPLESSLAKMQGLSKRAAIHI